MQVTIDNVIDTITSQSFAKVTASAPFDKNTQYVRVVIRPVNVKGKEMYQVESYTDKQVFHTNVDKQQLADQVAKLAGYKQICVVTLGKTYTYLISKKGAVHVTVADNNVCEVSATNNQSKNYIINEGDNVPALVDLGVFTKELKIVRSMYDKFKQINRFVELIDDEYGNCNQSSITVLDFGCGKSYLTFIVYYYFVCVKKIDATIIGYDLKADVVEHCNNVAKRYGYNKLQFVVADVTKDVLYDKDIDMVISLHACDTATDYALNYAISKGVKHIFSVPCCQHQVNNTIHKGGELDVLLNYGIIKERTSALVTDAMRALILEDVGYNVDVIEFVDLSHSPKNLMLRARLTHKPNYKHKDELTQLVTKYGFEQELFNLIYKK